MAGRRGMSATVACLVLGALALGATQAQGRANIDTDFADHGVDCGFAPPDCLYSGTLSSPDDRCLRKRKVQMFRILTSGKRVLVDTDRSSRHGNFVGLGASSEVSAAKFKVLPKQVGNDRCQGESFTGA